MMLCADLQGMKVSDNPQGTIPNSTVVTSAHPDIVIIEQKDVTLIELTISLNSLDSVTIAKEINQIKDYTNKL